MKMCLAYFIQYMYSVIKLTQTVSFDDTKLIISQCSHQLIMKLIHVIIPNCSSGLFDSRKVRKKPGMLGDVFLQVF